MVQQKRPEPRTMLATQFGGEKRIYLHMFVFYEDLIDYRIAALEQERQKNQDQLDDWQRKIRQKE